jgi:hypothetical protein
MAFAVSLSTLAACAASGGSSFTDTTSSALSGSGPGGSGAGGTGIIITTGAGGNAGGGGGPSVTYAYAHTNKSLYQFDPSAPTIAATKVGDFDCIGGAGQDSSMTDIAVGSQGDLWGVSAKNAYHLVVQGGAVHCDKTVSLTGIQATFYGLSFAPAGVIDAGETLIAGNTAGELWKIDTATGALTQHGTLGNVPSHDGQGHSFPLDSSVTGNTVGKPWELSGDIVFLANSGQPLGFATVRDCKSPPSSSSCDPTDTLIQIDMTKLKAQGAQDVSVGVRGAVVKRAGCADPQSGKGYGSMYGIAAWNDKIYGFSHQGPIVEISNTDGSACAIPGTSAQWDGAGVTTAAQVVAPPPPQ